MKVISSFFDDSLSDRRTFLIRDLPNVRTLSSLPGTRTRNKEAINEPSLVDEF